MLSVIPAPKKAKELGGIFVLPGTVRVKSDFELPLLKGKVEFCDSEEEASVIVIKDDKIAEEGYILGVTRENIVIFASKKIGVYYALQTVRQLAHLDTGGREVLCCDIEDEPRFGFRGLSLDVSRHFYDVDYVKKYLDWMFMQKLNVFHWHLTDDAGWRVEIKKYPLLTEIGSKRTCTQLNGWHSTKMEQKPYSGYYTQEQIKEIVAYAKERGITVIPEVDFPAHCAAVFAAYSDLACRDLKRDVPGYFGAKIPTKIFNQKDWNRTLCMGKEESLQFVYDVLDEICDMFDSPYIHVGGDEAPKDEWKKCPNCQRVIKENNLKNEEELQGWFENKLSQYLKTKGRQMIGWNEVLEGKNIDTSDKNIVVQYWTPKRDKNAEAYVNSGGKMIMSNHQSFYFDMPYAQYSLKKTYKFKPENFGVTNDNIKNVLGVEGEVWTEWIRGRERLEMLVFPRMQALSEVAWSPEEKRDFADFKLRLDDFKPTFDAMGINYAVDKISMLTNPFKRSKILKKFSKGNTELENQLNAQYKTKGER